MQSRDRRPMRQNVEVDVEVGDVVRVGDHLLTVVDIENGEVSFRLDSLPDDGPSTPDAADSTRLPR